LQHLKQVAPADRVESFLDVELHEKCWGFGHVQELHSVLDVDEIIMYASFFMKALWHFDTRESSNGANLFARILEKSLAILWIRLIGP
jgi:hypothetical protein